MNLRRLASICLMPVAIAACGGEPDRPGGNGEPPPLKTIEKTSALAAANANLRSILTGSARSANFANESQLLGDVFSMADDCASPAPQPGDPPPPDDPSCADIELEQPATETADRFAEDLLNIANIESEEATKLTLKVVPERVCDMDQKCIDALTANPLRFELTSRVENDIDVAVLVGEARTNPVNLQLYRSELAVEVDLGAAKTAAESLAAAFGESAELPGTFSGRVRFSIKKNAENNYSVTLAIVSAIDVSIDQDGERIAFHAGAANPAFKIDVDGNQKKLVTTLGFGELSGEVPLSSMFGSDAAPCTIDMNGNEVCDPPPPPVVGTVGYRLGALKMSTVITEAEMETATVDGIDFGNGFAMTIDNRPLVSFDADVRTVKVSSTAEGVRIGVLPSLTANLSLDFQAIADRIMEELPPYLLDDDFTLELKGAAEPALMIHEMNSAIEVVAGSLSIRSRAAGRTVEVNAGQCLLSDDAMEGSEPHPLELLSGGMCPQ